MGALMIAVMTALFPVTARAQIPSFGGCADGREMGYVTVTSAADLREWDTGTRFLRALPGDELRLCRFEDASAIVTVWSRGYGYRIPRAVVDSAGPPTVRALSERESNCLAYAIDDVQRRYRSREQGRRLLELARLWRVSVYQVAEVRLITRSGRPADCTPPS